MIAVRDELACRVISFGTNESADLRATEVESVGFDGTRFVVTYEGEGYRAHSPLPGLHTVPAALTTTGMAMNRAIEALASSTYTGRMVKRAGFNGSTLLDDRYNSSPASLEGALQMMGEARGRRVALLGPMAELGDAERSEHCRLGKVAAANCDVLAATGEPCRVLIESAKEAGLRGAQWFADRDQAAEWVRAQLEPGDTVLLKASRSQAFEQIVPLLEAGS